MDINSYISSGIIETYVMGLCTPDEISEVELLRLRSPVFNEAIVKFEKEFENNLQKNATLPGQETDEKILRSLKNLHTPVLDINDHKFKTKEPAWFKFVAAAAILFFIVSVIFNYILYKKLDKQQIVLNEKQNYSPLPVADYNILKQPTITPVAMYGVAPHSICRCTIFWDKKTGKAFIMIHHLPPSSNNNYQLWAMVNGNPVSVGIVNDKIRDRFIEMQNVPAGATAFIVTLEKSGGSLTPTEEETYLSGNI
ncbi:MAG: anti-sigma factor [Ferruginibacter sp.]